MPETKLNEEILYEIPGMFFHKLSAYVAKLGKRAERLGLAPIELVEVSRAGHVVDEDLGITFPVITARIDGTMPQLSGWEFIGTIDHGQDRNGNPANVIRAIVEDVPAEFRSAEKTCAHCDTKRARKNTYLVRSEFGKVKQVGSSCLKDYTGHKNAASVAKWLEALMDLLDELTGKGYSIEQSTAEIYAMMAGSGSGPGYADPVFDLTAFLRITYRAIRSYGWTSKSKGGEATADRVANFIFDEANPMTRKHADQKLKVKRENETEIITGALAWLEGLTEDELTNDYLYNLRTIAERGDIKYQSFGYAASIIPSYLRTLEAQREREEKPESQYVGEIKKRQQFEGMEVIAEIPLAGQYGTTYLYKIEDAAGNAFTWFSSTGELKVGKTYEGKATVKKHDLYRGVKQTIITRAKFAEMAA